MAKHHTDEKGRHSPAQSAVAKRMRGKEAKVMHEYKHHELHSGSKHGPVVKEKKQAEAIAMSEGQKAEHGHKKHHGKKHHGHKKHHGKHHEGAKHNTKHHEKHHSARKHHGKHHHEHHAE